MGADLNSFTDAVVEQNPLHAKFLASSLEGMSDDLRRELISYLDYCTRRGLGIDYLADCYSTIVNDTRTEQLFFWKYGRYRYDRFRDVADKVYLDDAYMNKYMYGLALTAFLWPNHAALSEFFERSFPRGKKGAYLEIGPGHGYYLKRAAELGAFETLTGIDLSPTSVEMTRDILAHSGFTSRGGVHVLERDFLDFSANDATYSCVVMGEVLEHVEDPGLFLRKIAELSDRDTHIFVTTCCNAPAVDHIFLFRSPHDVEDLVLGSGLDIVDSTYVPYAGKTLEECERDALSVNVAYVLRKR
jgi:2-polyprenyl-3-methyl-5-hydroxy-6-metoxy-1,4-benzoquinol methylase